MGYKPFSRKQLEVLTWWHRQSRHHGRDAVICDGAVRSGKTLCLSLSFVAWAMSAFDGADFALCGKTVTSLSRNLVAPLLPLLQEAGLACRYLVSKGRLEVSCMGRQNRFHLFGGRDESSAALIQGITLSGVLLDEVALMPRSFVEQALARCSVAGSRFWFSCNPEHPLHWFYQEWVLKPLEKRILHLHFTMADNNSLSADTKLRYERLYSGVFYDRYIRGLWVVAEGIIYRQFAENKATYVRKLQKDDLRDVMYVSIGVDFGGSQSLTTFVATALHTAFNKVTVIADHHIQLALVYRYILSPYVIVHLHLKTPL